MSPLLSVRRHKFEVEVDILLKMFTVCVGEFNAGREEGGCVGTLVGRRGMLKYGLAWGQYKVFVWMSHTRETVSSYCLQPSPAAYLSCGLSEHCAHSHRDAPVNLGLSSSVVNPKGNVRRMRLKPEAKQVVRCSKRNGAEVRSMMALFWIYWSKNIDYET